MSIGINDRFLGDPDRRVKQWILDNMDPTYNSKFTIDLAKWGPDEDRPSILPEPSLSANLISSNYILNDGYVNDEGNYVSVSTSADVISSLNNLSTITYPWMIWGYDIDFPEYVKYRNGGTFVYVRSVQDIDETWNVAGSLVEDFTGQKIYKCKWDKILFKKKYYDTGRTVKSMSSAKFTYGDNCTYSVPDSITDSNGVVYTFCGHTVTLHAKNPVTSTNDNGQKLRCSDHFNDSKRYSSYGDNQYYYSLARMWLNSRVGYSEFEISSEYSGSKNSGGIAEGSNGLPTKFFKDVYFMKMLVPQVSRVWNFHNQEKPDICIDEFSLIPASEMGFQPSWIIQTYDTSKSTLYTTDQYDKRRIQYRYNLDGSLSSEKIYYWIRSAYALHAALNTHANTFGAVNYSESFRVLGYSPMALIG